MIDDSKWDSPAGIQAAAAPGGEDPRWIALKPSRVALGITLVAAAGALAVILLTPLPLGLRVGFIVCWMVAAVLETRSAALVTSRAVVGLTLRDAEAPADGAGPPLRVDLRLRGRPGLPASQAEIRDAQVLYGGVVTPWFTTLKYRLPHDARWRRVWPRVVPVWFDAIDAGAFRKLRVALKWK